MNIIEKTKHDGAVRALRERLESLRFQLTNRNWSRIENSEGFCRMGEAIADARQILKKMEQTLEALQELEPHNQ